MAMGNTFKISSAFIPKWHIFFLLWESRFFFFSFPLANQQKRIWIPLCASPWIFSPRENRIFMKYITYIYLLKRVWCNTSSVLIWSSLSLQIGCLKTLSLFCNRMGKYCYWVRVPGTKLCGLILPEDKNMSCSKTKISEERNR